MIKTKKQIIVNEFQSTDRNYKIVMINKENKMNDLLATMR